MSSKDKLGVHLAQSHQPHGRDRFNKGSWPASLVVLLASLKLKEVSMRWIMFLRIYNYPATVNRFQSHILRLGPVDFHPLNQISTLRCKNRQPFSEFTMRVTSATFP